MWYQLPEINYEKETSASVGVVENEHNYSKEKNIDFINGIYSHIFDFPKIVNEGQAVSHDVQSLEIILNGKSELVKCNFEENKKSSVYTVLSSKIRNGVLERFLCDICGGILGSAQALRKHRKIQHFTDHPLDKICRKRVDVIIPNERLEEQLTANQLSHFSSATQSTLHYHYSNTIPQTKTSIKNSPETSIQSSHNFDQTLSHPVDVLTAIGNKPSSTILADVVSNSGSPDKTVLNGYEANSSSKPSKRCYCTICGKWFTNKYVLATHKIFHTGVRPFSCKYCSKAFKTNGHRQTHERRHFKKEESEPIKTNNERGLIDKNTSSRSMCDLCGQVFVNKYVMATHKKFHSGIKPFSCRYCEKSFKTKGQLKVHEKRHEKI